MSVCGQSCLFGGHQLIFQMVKLPPPHHPKEKVHMLNQGPIHLQNTPQAVTDFSGGASSRHLVPGYGQSCMFLPQSD